MLREHRLLTSKRNPYLVPLLYCDFTKSLTPRKAVNYTYTYTRASDATYTTDAGIVATASSGTPRLTSKGYFVEQQSTNLVLHNEDMSSWSDIGTPTLSSGAATCGDLSLDLLGDNDAAGLEGKSQVIGFTGNAQKSVSFFVKKGTSTSTVIRLRDTTAPADRLLLAITWTGNTPIVTYTTGSEEFPTEALADNVYRIRALTSSVTAANTNQLEIYPASDAALATGATGDIYINGFQAEDSTYATSLIFTTTTTVTRSADSLIYDINNLYNIKGTIFWEVQSNWSSPSKKNCSFFGKNAADGVFVDNAQASTVFKIHDGTGNVSSSGYGDIATGMRKRSVAWGINGRLFAGAGSATQNVSFDGNMNFAGIQVGCAGAGEELNGWIKSIKIYNKEINTTTAIKLTT